jgi:hypothetical protein
MQINADIVASAETGEPTVLLSTVELHLPLMNVVNISTALHRLAKLTAALPEEQAAVRRHPVLAGLLMAAHTALLRGQACGAVPQCQALSNITWSLATLQLVDTPLLELVARLGREHAATFKSFELTTILWSLAKLTSGEAPLGQHAESLFRYASDYIATHVEEFTFRCLVMAAWSFAKVQHHDGSVFRTIAAQMLPDVCTAGCQELANTAWAFGTAGVRHDALFAEIAEQGVRRVSGFSAQELSSILWSFAANGFLHEGFFDSASAAARVVDLQPRQLANILCVISQMRPQHSVTRVTVLALLRKCTRVPDEFHPQELSSVALAAARSFGRGTAEPAEVASPPLPVAEFLAVALPRVLPFLAGFMGQSLSNVATALVHLQSGDASQQAELFVAIGEEVIRRVGSLESSALLLLLRDLPEAPRDSCGAAVRALLSEAARRIDELQPKELQTLSRICAGMLGCRGGVLSKEMLRGCCHSLARAGMWDATERRNASTFEAPEASSSEEDNRASADSSVPRKTRTKGSAPTASTASTCSSDEEVEPKRMIDYCVPQFHWGYSVKNTFVDFDDTDSTDGSDTEVARRLLGAPLDIIPSEISLEKLDAYRASYQRFRLGNAVGAKGELTSTVV